MRFTDRGVVLVPQSEIQCHVMLEFTLILSIPDVVLQFSQTDSGCAIVEWARLADITQVLDGRRLVCQKVWQVIKHVRAAAPPIRVEKVTSDLGSGFDVCLIT